MKTEEVNKKVIHYISDDGKDFGEDKAACTLYEFNNPYVKDIAKIPKLENILFFHTMIDDYWCESKEDIDLCCQYFQECKRKENLMTLKRNENINYLDSLCVGRFLYPGYYFIIKLNSDKIDSYGMFSLMQLKNFWEVFLAHIPESPEQKEKLKELKEELNKYAIQEQNKEINNLEDIDDLPKNVKEIFENIEKQSMIDNKKNIPKIYTSDNLSEYKSEKKLQEDTFNE